MNPPPFGFVLVLLGCAGAGAVEFWPEESAPAPAANLLILCDPSGSRAEDVCTHDLVRRRGVAWWAGAVGTPDAWFKVLRSAGDFGHVDAVLALHVPTSWGGGPRLGMMRAERDAEQRMEHIVIEPDEDATVNQSDLVALLAVASRTVEESAGPTDLLLASDGRFISAGFNAERRVPTPAQVEARLKIEGVRIDLSGVRTFTICGLHNHDTTAEKDQALHTFWATFIPDLGGVPPTILSSCLYLAAAVTTVAPARESS